MAKKRDPYKKAVGERLARARAAKELSQVDLADLLGISPQKLWNWEDGTSLFPPGFMQPIARFLGIDANYLYQGREDSLPSDLLKSLHSLKEPGGPEKTRTSAVKRR